MIQLSDSYELVCCMRIYNPLLSPGTIQSDFQMEEYTPFVSYLQSDWRNSPKLAGNVLTIFWVYFSYPENVLSDVEFPNKTQCQLLFVLQSILITSKD